MICTHSLLGTFVPPQFWLKSTVPPPAVSITAKDHPAATNNGTTNCQFKVSAVLMDRELNEIQAAVLLQGGGLAFNCRHEIEREHIFINIMRTK